MAQDKNKFSSCKMFIQGCHQNLFLGLFFLLIIYLNDLFYLAEPTNVCNFPDDTTFYACDSFKI